MIRKVFFWLHLSVGITAGLFIFVMAATGVLLSFERQIIDFADRDIRFVSVPQDPQPGSLKDLLDAVRHSVTGKPTALTLRNLPQASVQVSLGRSGTVYVDPYSNAILGVSSIRTHEFFSAVERFHRTLGAPLGSKSIGHWLAAISNLLFGVLILLGVVLWVPRKWNRKALRAVIAFRPGLRGKPRDWSWHNVIGIWCALPLLVISMTGVVMSFGWANTLLFQLTGSAAPAPRRDSADFHAPGRNFQSGQEPNYDRLFAAAKSLDPNWRTITLNLANGVHTPVSATVDTGTGGQPQKRTQYLLDQETGAVVKTTKFADGSLGQRLRTFVRFGHTGEYGGWPGQLIAAIASLGACMLVYTGLSLAARRFTAALTRRRKSAVVSREAYEEQPVA